MRISSGPWVRSHTAQLPSMDRVTEPSGLAVMFSGISPAAKSNVAAVPTSVTTDPPYEPPVPADADGAETSTAAVAVTASATPTFLLRKRCALDVLRRTVCSCCCCMTLQVNQRVADQWHLGDTGTSEMSGGSGRFVRNGAREAGPGCQAGRRLFLRICLSNGGRGDDRFGERS